MVKYFQEITSLAKEIFLDPELGYKEFNTKNRIVQFVKKYSTKEFEIQEFSTTGLKISLPIDKTKNFNLAVIAELDAVFSPSHMFSNKETGAAHNCGHHAQIGIALALFRALTDDDFYKTLNYNVSFIFTPAEEYVDLKYREMLIEEGTIKYWGGKPEAMRLGIFDNVDCAILTHSMGGATQGRVIELNSTLIGFLYKKYMFKGRSAHAGFAPHEGINAYSISTLFHTGVGLLRQHLNEADVIRINPVILDSNMGSNVICDHIVIGTDVRGKTVDAIIDVSKKIDSVARGSAISLQGELCINTQYGYLPFHQDKHLTKVAKLAYDNFPEIEMLITDSVSSASGDVGDLSYMVPCIQVGFSGFSGTIHGQDFCESDEEYIYEIFPRYMMSILTHINLDQSKLYKRTYSEYESLLNSIYTL